MNDVVLAIYSDRLFMAAVGVYVLAMVLHAAEYAALARGAAAGRRRPSAVAVGATAAAPAVRRRRPARRDLSDESAAVRAPGPTGSAGRR